MIILTNTVLNPASPPNMNLLKYQCMQYCKQFSRYRVGVLNLFCATDPSESLVKPMDPISEKCI